MSDENVELVKQGFEHWREGRIDEWLTTVDPDIEWDISAHPLPDFPDHGKGREALEKHLAGYLAGWNNYEMTVEELIDGGDDVVLISHESARMRGSDLVLDRDLPMVWTIANGLSVRLRVFKTRAQALDAAGLPE